MLKIFSWNINGLRACWNKNGLQNLVSSFKPDIICLQEIKAQPDQITLDDLKEYQAVWNPASRKGYSGTLILSKKPILSQNLNFPQNIVQKYDLNDQFGDSNQEGRLIAAEFDNFYLVNVYTPNSKGDLTRLNLRFKAWDPAFLDYCRLLERDKPVIMTGDFNVAHQEIDLARPKENVGKHGFTQEERAGFENFIQAGFLDTFRYFYPQQTEAYTWWTHWGKARLNNVGWRIDYFLTSRKLKNNLKEANIYPKIMGSDHCPTSITINL